ncbi:hypothetical protein FE257_001409 [Aspergillus nanangensis]|uniref:Benzoate 4-monooxygenase cytochrome P450 n=1 Tax=Aspergillus nanangensis TaxID=2582783 RepID=A0AAD4CDU8_ASPNN|nr:hypothetical protein FE257_001409 [Aspergillus nanangensis]
MESEMHRLAGGITVISAIILLTVKRLYFHPLSRHNGPLLWAISRLPYMLAFRSGQLAHRIKQFHEIYGDTVRVAPNEVSFIDPSCVQDIYKKRPSPQFKSLPKDPIRQPPPIPGQPVSILDAGDADHARIRKAYAPAFSSQALHAQEPLVVSYVDKMIAQLKARATTASPPDAIDLQKWFSYCTFDIICALSFGEDFACLDNDRYHEWLGALVYSLKAKVQLAACRFYPWLFKLLLMTMPKSAQTSMANHQATTREKVQKRRNASSSSQLTSRPDFLSYLDKSTKQLSEDEIIVNAATLIVAGSHTLQTAITGITYQLLQNPRVLEKVTTEVRSAFAGGGEHMDARALAKLPLLNAAIKEGIRLTSPVPLGLTRRVPSGGAIICDMHFPEGWAANVSRRNYTEPMAFVLERWLEPTIGVDEGARFRNDRTEATQPFLQGPRDCLGQNLAKMEILLLLAHLLYNFDMSLPLGEAGTLEKWEDQETYAVWVKSPLLVRLTPIRFKVEHD